MLNQETRVNTKRVGPVAFGRVNGRAGQGMCALIWLSLLLAGVVGVGCKSVKPVRYISPHITGCVVDAETRQPVKGVKVSKIDPRQAREQSLEPPKGGQALLQPSTAFTDQDGRFVLESEKSLTPIFGAGGWYSVSVSFDHPSYVRTAVSYGSENATNSLNGVPMIDAGEVALLPRAKK